MVANMNDEERHIRELIEQSNSEEYRAKAFSLLRTLASSSQLSISFEGQYKYLPAIDEPKIICTIPFVIASGPLLREIMKRDGVFDATILEAHLRVLERASISNGKFGRGAIQFNKKYLPGPFGVYNPAVINYEGNEREKGHYLGEWRYTSTKTGRDFKGEFELTEV
jgi:hypothetical protein